MLASPPGRHYFKWITIPTEVSRPFTTPLTGKKSTPAPAIAYARSPDSYHPRGPPLAQWKLLAHLFDRGAPSRGRQNFFPSTALNAWLSSVRSATLCFNRQFSSSRCGSRRASFTSSPPYFAFQRQYTRRSYILVGRAFGDQVKRPLTFQEGSWCGPWGSGHAIQL